MAPALSESEKLSLKLIEQYSFATLCLSTVSAIFIIGATCTLLGINWGRLYGDMKRCLLSFRNSPQQEQPPPEEASVSPTIASGYDSQMSTEPLMSPEQGPRRRTQSPRLEHPQEVTEAPRHQSSPSIAMPSPLRPHQVRSAQLREQPTSTAPRYPSSGTVNSIDEILNLHMQQWEEMRALHNRNPVPFSNPREKHGRRSPAEAEGEEERERRRDTAQSIVPEPPVEVNEYGWVAK